ncbi:MAG TPA: type II secretion system F family protein [Bryobacteraceae bacterium]|jgi:tight adherence protein B|nr:type II secretion system F family protein [Bryobacteraceae bacterium]
MLLFISLFVVNLIAVLVAVGLGFAVLRTRENSRLQAMLRNADPVIAERSAELLRPATVENTLTRMLRSLGLTQRIDLFLDQAGFGWTSGKLIVASIGAGLLGAMIGDHLPLPGYHLIGSAVLFCLLGLMPWLVVRHKRAKRIAAFEEQFPEALDFLARSLRAGHAFSVGLEMLVLDSPDPLASVFRRTMNDLHLGSPMSVAFSKMADLIPILDVRFFIASVLLQQDTGGNLSEILSKLSFIIRERFRLKGQVKAASAHGRITGMVLVFMPVSVGVLMFLSTPSYFMVLINEHIGRMMLAFGVIAQVVGYFCIQKIVTIKV